MEELISANIVPALVNGMSSIRVDHFEFEASLADMLNGGSADMSIDVEIFGQMVHGDFSLSPMAVGSELISAVRQALF